jgi:hypothetical protein
MLSERNISDVRAGWPEHFHVYAEAPNRYFEGKLDDAALSALLRRIGESTGLSNESRTSALFGFGSQTRHLYGTLDDMPGLDVVWEADFSPWWLRPLGLIAAAHGGLIRVGDARAVPEAVQQLAHRAMVEAYSIRSETWQRVRAYVLDRTWRSFIGSVIGREDPSYFCLGVDGDSPDTEAYVVWSSFGPECPGDLQRAVGVKYGA